MEKKTNQDESKVYEPIISTAYQTLDGKGVNHGQYFQDKSILERTVVGLKGKDKVTVKLPPRKGFAQTFVVYSKNGLEIANKDKSKDAVWLRVNETLPSFPKSVIKPKDLAQIITDVSVDAFNLIGRDIILDQLGLDTNDWDGQIILKSGLAEMNQTYEDNFTIWKGDYTKTFQYQESSDPEKRIIETDLPAPGINTKHSLWNIRIGIRYFEASYDEKSDNVEWKAFVNCSQILWRKISDSSNLHAEIKREEVKQSTQVLVEGTDLELVLPTDTSSMTNIEEPKDNVNRSSKGRGQKRKKK